MFDDVLDQINHVMRWQKVNLGLIFADKNFNIEEEEEEYAEDYDNDVQDNEEYEQNNEEYQQTIRMICHMLVRLMKNINFIILM